ncbi:MAG: DNA polymerase III subunit gamma/tau [Nevskiaceae bacterium]|jgi:DNA polymerase-3 subunit gamma/tau|nr:DNA polymerase III subunit gamma/tau [Nevskiaceae bacterium]
MSYTALARKYRPRSFAEMSGQEHVLRALINALQEGRVHHAFLFTGTRGVGKTTIARIFAKCLNCETGVTATPCGECAACQDIDAGRFVDLLEVDAASRTKVEDTRDLLDNVQYLPSRGRYKVYLIDEVHMLSAHSFNALLKTLEEPPPHVKFLLATTDPQKLPVTVLSRCLQFNLKRLSVAVIAVRLTQIMQMEGIAAEPVALRQVAVAADGSMRDALSLLDQLLAFGSTQGITEADARAMLGTVDRNQVLGLARALAGGDIGAVLEQARALEQWSPDYQQMLDELNSLLARVALYQAAGSSWDEEETPVETLAELAAAITAEDLQLYYQIGLLGRRDLPLASDVRSAFAMTLVRMLAFRPGGVADAPPARGSAPATTPSQMRNASPAAMGRSTASAASTSMSASAPALEPANWNHIVELLEVSGLARQLAINCALLGREGAVVRLALDARSQSMRMPASEDKLAAALSKLYGQTLRVAIEVGVAAPQATPARERDRLSDEAAQAARESLDADPAIAVMRRQFGATIFAESVRPNRNEES